MKPERHHKEKERVRKLFFSPSKESLYFNWFLLAANIMAIFLFILDPLLGNNILFRSLEMAFGVFFLTEYCLLLWISHKRLRFIFDLLSLLDLIVIASLFAPLLLGNFAFLRIIRSLRILRSYSVLKRLKKKSGYFAQHEELITNIVNMGVFIFIMTDIVYVTQVKSNDEISNFIDALYFTLGTLTTTGFGDITLHGSNGKVLAILIMVFGITLFVKLGKSVIRPQKIYYECEHCGLKRHEYDASHCKHCGNIVHIEDGED